MTKQQIKNERRAVYSVFIYVLLIILLIKNIFVNDVKLIV